MAPTNSSPLDPVSLKSEKDGRRQRLRAPWRHGAWTPEEVASALHTRRKELLRELRGLPSARGLPVDVLEEILDDAVCAVVMKPRAILNEEHLGRRLTSPPGSGATCSVAPPGKGCCSLARSVSRCAL